MALDIFNRPGNDLGGSFAADAAKIVFSGGGTGAGGPQAGGVGLLTQNLQVNYQQQITRIYEIGSNLTFLVAGRAMGNVGMGRVLGPRRVQAQFYKNYGNVCNAANNNINLELAAGCQGANSGELGRLTLAIKNVVLTSVAFSVASQDMVINEQVQGIFVSLDAQAA